MKARILVVDDEKNVRFALGKVLEDQGYEVATEESAEEAFRRISGDAFDLALVDIRLGALSGLRLMEKCKEESKSIGFLVMSGNGSLQEAAESIRKGAAEFLQKPISPEALTLAVEKALRLRNLEKEVVSLRQNQSSEILVGKSAPMNRLRDLVQRLAGTKAKILITGESGTGKELVATALHRWSPISSKPFLKVNCAAIPSELVESELFGHERGAFTQAHQMRKGLFELAHEGTLFLDEIGELPLAAQAKLLRVLQSQEFSRVGGSQVIKTEVRVIAATNVNLERAVKEGSFREDLLFRLNVVPIEVPPLRERAEDVPLLADLFLRAAVKENQLNQKSFEPRALGALQDFHWPGNVRELKNVVERLAILSESIIEEGDVRAQLRTPKEAGPLSFPLPQGEELTLEEYRKRAERFYLISVLKKEKGNISASAKILGVERTYLHRKLQDLGVNKRDYF
jgi:two-component system, NtrC family, nitrogen regulation response regulator NtrX